MLMRPLLRGSVSSTKNLNQLRAQLDFEQLYGTARTQQHSFEAHALETVTLIGGQPIANHYYTIAFRKIFPLQVSSGVRVLNDAVTMGVSVRTGSYAIVRGYCVLCSRGREGGRAGRL